MAKANVITGAFLCQLMYNHRCCLNAAQRLMYVSLFKDLVMCRFFRFFPKPIKDTVTNTGVVLASTLIGGGIYSLGQSAYDFGSQKLVFFNSYFKKTSIAENQQPSEKQLEKSPVRYHS